MGTEPYVLVSRHGAMSDGTPTKKERTSLITTHRIKMHLQTQLQIRYADIMAN